MDILEHVFSEAIGPLVSQVYQAARRDQRYPPGPAGLWADLVGSGLIERVDRADIGDSAYQIEWRSGERPLLRIARSNYRPAECLALGAAVADWWVATKMKGHAVDRRELGVAVILPIPAIREALSLSWGVPEIAEAYILPVRVVQDRVRIALETSSSGQRPSVRLLA